MKSITAGRFKDLCLETLEEVARTHTTVVITKRGKPVAKLVPYAEPASVRSLESSLRKESGDPYSTGEKWGVDAT